SPVRSARYFSGSFATVVLDVHLLYKLQPHNLKTVQLL
ncbi:MAG: hypothetical protein RLZZ574_2718, partial [Cyanobacteriota bacterium]